MKELELSMMICIYRRSDTMRGCKSQVDKGTIDLHDFRSKVDCELFMFGKN